jgi:YidC/Oxa1 family membrane protein insertase
VIYVGSQLSSSYFMSVTADKTQRMLLMVLPIVFVPFIIRFPVGLVLYWVTTNLWTVGQGLITRRLIPKPAAPVKRSSRSAPREAPAASDTDGDAKAVAATEPKPAATPPAAPRRVKRKKKRTRR